MDKMIYVPLDEYMKLVSDSVRLEMVKQALDDAEKKDGICYADILKIVAGVREEKNEA